MRERKSERIEITEWRSKVGGDCNEQWTM